MSRGLFAPDTIIILSVEFSNGIKSIYIHGSIRLMPRILMEDGSEQYIEHLPYESYTEIKPGLCETAIDGMKGIFLLKEIENTENEGSEIINRWLTSLKPREKADTRNVWQHLIDTFER